MARLNAQQFAEKWSRRMGQAGQDIAAGVQRTTKDPGALAAAQKALWAQKLADPKTQDMWAHNVQVGAAAWKSAMTDKGIPRISSGVQRAATTKIGRFTALLNAVDASVQDANATPRGSLDQNLVRANTFARAMHGRAPKRTGQ